MPLQEPLHVVFLAGKDGRCGEPLCDYLRMTRGVHVEVRHTAHLPADLDDYRVLMLVDPASLPTAEQERVTAYVRRGGGCLGLVCSSTEPLPPLFGAQAGPPGPHTELFLSFTDPNHPISKRLPSTLYLRDRFQPLEPNVDSQPILNTAWRFQEVPLALLRDEGEGRVCCTTLQAYNEPFVQQFIYRAVRHLAGLEEPAPLGVAVLGYSKAVGYLHGLAVQEVPGLELRAACDTSRERLEQAQKDFPGVRVCETVRELGGCPDVDLVIIATPPSSHADLAIQFLQGKKHVVCEKPMCLTQEEAEAMIQTADEYDRVLSCYQNRRWDVDYLAVRQALQEGLIGEPFYLETFVGDYSHPCKYWHSHCPISGGTLYDWGAHYVDWILNLFPGPTASVTGTLHKRVWHDVTNADQVRVQIRFADGREAEFLHSDVAALRKPKWYLLGTEGAIVGQWNEITLREPDPVAYMREMQVPVTETVPLLILRRRHSSSSMMTQQLPLPKPRRHSYYLNLADHLLTGEPLAVSAHSAARVVAVLETATRSARRGGIAEVLHV
jgi:predicted dehydrogenase